MRNTVKRFLSIGVASAALAACDAAENLTEKVALNTALTSSGALTGAGAAGAYAPFAVFMIPTTGTMGPTAAAAVNAAVNASLSGIRTLNYEGAVGIQVTFDGADGDASFTGVVGWDGLNTSASTVDVVVVAGSITSTNTAPGNGTYAIPSAGYSTYWTRSPNTSYVGTSGSFVLVSTAFDGAQTNCPAQVTGVTTCNYRTGTMNGNFAFGALQTGSSGTYNQPSITFANLPSVKITIVE